jgi:hypothetical protein
MKRPRRYLVLVLLFILAPTTDSARATQKCPTVWVAGPTSDLMADSPIVFTARLSGVNPTARPEFRWETSAGTIVSGQGTPSITIDTVGLGGVTVSVKVTVSGIATTCPAEASRSANVYPKGIICALPFDKYGEITFANEEARLDNFAIQIQNQPGSKGYIFVYAGRRSYEGEAVEHLRRVKEYLVGVRQIDPSGIVTVDGGYKEDFEVTLVIVPSGAAPSSAMPTLSPAEIELTKPRPKSPRKTSRHNSRNK